jgi:hypothetical protein
MDTSSVCSSAKSRSQAVERSLARAAVHFFYFLYNAIQRRRGT